MFAFSHARQILASLILFLLIESGTSSAQIPINGFCRYESYKTGERFSNLIALNFNNDSYSDLLFFGSGEKNTAACKGQDGARFTVCKNNKLHFDISQISLLESKPSSNSLYAFTSRKDRVVGIASISGSGIINVLSEKKVDSYPDNLRIADIDHNGSREILVSGGAFNGISVFYLRKGKLEERKLFNNKIFSHLVVVDLNNDSYPDIAAFDLIENSLRFFYNNSIGEFYEVRQFKIDGKISVLASYDFNLDNIQDLIYTCSNRIDFLFGDHRAAFSSRLSVSVEDKIDNLAIGDLNRDGLLDLSYISREKSKLSVLFAQEQAKFYPEIQYLSKDGLSALIPFYSKYIHGLVALSNSGDYYLLSEVNGFRDNLKISLGVKPSLIKYFDAGNDAIADLCYYDKGKQSLNLIIRNSEGIPSKYYSIFLLDICTNLEIEEFKDRTKKIFYCYSKGKKLIEVVSVDFRKKLVSKDKIYAAGPIEDLKVSSDEQDGEKPLIYILLSNQGTIRLQCCKYSNFRYTSISSNILAKDVLQAKMLVNDPVTLFYWKKVKKGYSFNKIFLNNDLHPQDSRAKFVLPFYYNTDIFNFAGDIFNNNGNEALNLVFSNNNSFAVVSSADRCFKLSLKGSLKDLRLQSVNQICSMENDRSGLNDLFVYNSMDGWLEKLDLLNKQKYLLGKKVVETKNIESYFVRSLSSGKYHLVYTDKAENCIKIREIFF